MTDGKGEFSSMITRIMLINKWNEMQPCNNVMINIVIYYRYLGRFVNFAYKLTSIS